jgi:3-deoxy-D-arabino-heptulosonate 7-phosphate (DAHP) synthase class II
MERVYGSVTNKKGILDWMIGFTIQSNRTQKQYSAIADLRNLQFTVTHAIGFSVFTSRIQKTELKQSHCD